MARTITFARPVITMTLRQVPGEPDLDGNPTTVETFVPVTTLSATVTDGDVSLSETVTIETLGQLDGNAGNTRSLLDATAAERNAALAVWRQHLDAAMDQALLDNESVQAKAAALLADWGL
jgi:hypothetical protein